MGVRPLPGSVHDKKAEWIWGVLAELEAAGLVVLADKGYQGSTHAKTPYKGKNKPQSQKTPTARTRNSARPASARRPAQTWKILRNSALPKANCQAIHVFDPEHNQDGNSSFAAVPGGWVMWRELGSAFSMTSPSRISMAGARRSASARRTLSSIAGQDLAASPRPRNGYVAPDLVGCTRHERSRRSA